MKKLASRAVFALVLTAALLLGTVVFCIRYVASADDWVSFPGSPHVYTGGNLTIGQVTDSRGTFLLASQTSRTYSGDPQVRAATVHLLGDHYGYIDAPLLGHFADEMVGYDLVNGLYSLSDDETSAILTIDARIQTAALTALAGRKGTVGVYNYQTGEILCAVTSPSYDPDNVPDLENDTEGIYDGIYVNRFFDAAYTPGSIYKLLTTAAALETVDGVMDQTFLCEGETILAGQKIICEGEHQTIGIKDGLAVSCNCVYGPLAVEVGSKSLQKYADGLGLTGRLECDGNKTAPGVCELKDANDGDLAWAGIGQYTDQVTAYAFLRFMGVLGGGGEAAEPYLMEALSKGGKTIYAHEAATTGRLLQAQTCATMEELMRNNVQRIYGQWQFGDLPVCAKSGTAEVTGQAPNAMFAGYVASDQYPLAFVVFVEEGGHGSAVAAPIAAQVLLACQEAMGAD